MQDLSFFIRPIKDYIVTQNLVCVVIPTIQTIDLVFLPEQQNITHLYLISYDDYISLDMSEIRNEKLTFIVSGVRDTSIDTDHLPNCNVIFTNCGRTVIYNKLNAIIAKHRTIYDSLVRNVNQNFSAQSLLNELAKQTGFSVAIIGSKQNLAYKCFCKEFVNPLVCSLKPGDLVPLSFLNYMRDQKRKITDSIYSGPMPNNKDEIYHFLLIEHDPFLRYFFCIGNRNTMGFDALFLLELAELMISILYQLNGAHADSPDFSMFLSDMLEGRLNSTEQFMLRETYISPPLGKYCGWVIVYNSNLSLFSQQASELRNIIECDHIAIHGRYIIALKSYKNSKGQLEKVIDIDRFKKYLEKWESFAAVDYATSIRPMLKTRFLLTEEALKVGMQMDKNKDKRIYFYDQYASYIILKLCSESYRSLVGHENIIFLGHPSIVDIHKADPKGKYGYMKILKAYLLSGGNIASTANSVFMHKNTVARKMKEIEEVLQLDLHDGSIRDRLLFSISIYEFLGAYPNIDIEKLILQDNIEEMHLIKLK